ncbi:MAG: hypothetical protein WC812_00280 [Candidatus Pacearchaeota archaeon]|jgi:hypothetical protein
MRLENIKCDNEEARKALDNLPRGVVKNEITGFAEYNKKGILNKKVPALQIFIKSGLSSLNAPKGSKEFSATLNGFPPYASFVYKDIQYIFINNE